MSQWTAYAFSGIGVAAVALYSLFTSGHQVRRIIAVNLLGNGLFLLLVALARRDPSGPPDPVPHALVLTGVVVSVSATACALALARRLHEPEAGTRSRNGGGDQAAP